MNTPDDFWSKVKISNPNSCWEWIGKPTHPTGYGQFQINNKRFSTHVYSAYLAGKVAGPQQMICHTCNNGSCVNPAHLYVGNSFDNAKDRLKDNKYYTGQSNPNSSTNQKQRKHKIALVKTLIANGLSNQQIVLQTGMCIDTIRKYRNLY